MGRSIIKREIVEQEIFERHDGKIVMLEFKSSSSPGKFKCLKCGKEWIAKPTCVANRTGCPGCQLINDKLTYEYVNNELMKLGCKLISKTYISAKDELEVLFSCGHIGFLCYNEIKQGRIICANCGIKRGRDSHRTKETRIINFLTENNFIFLSFPNGFFEQKTSLVNYECEFGHITTRTIEGLFRRPTCGKYERLFLAEQNSGINNHWWKGGTSQIRTFALNKISEWKKDSMKACNYKCIITGERFDHIHHLYSFSNIIEEALINLNLPLYKDISFYSNNELGILSDEIIRLHYVYPLGVCLTEKIHMLYHSIFGKSNATPEKFHEFCKKIKTGEIIVPNL